MGSSPNPPLPIHQQETSGFVPGLFCCLQLNSESPQSGADDDSGEHSRQSQLTHDPRHPHCPVPTGRPIVKSGSPTELLRAIELSDLFKTPLEVVEKNDFRQVVPGT